MHHHEVVAYQQSFSASVSGGSSMASLWLCLLSPSIQFIFPCLPKFCPINKPRQFFLFTDGIHCIQRGIPHHQITYHLPKFRNRETVESHKSLSVCPQLPLPCSLETNPVLSHTFTLGTFCGLFLRIRTWGGDFYVSDSLNGILTKSRKREEMLDMGRILGLEKS